ncbi:hypothetical protein P280DRAFT_272506 [Massarina eburnea CBS 473.64]|uniref:Zn(2)-C6 fungal-type domain-containing protein n=1 Tax=Massarina eburnea CBS 473.64 TaxID=1395130 RepID=A0A6A6S7L5_9PLEO|nr:hypothetical protein P280DRAFT_272506 [Massarina eburnea CBS 473.64]
MEHKMNMLSPQIPVSNKRRRANHSQSNRTACATCHQRKVKCDAQTVGFPCTNCRKHSRSDCVWHQKRKRLPIRSPHNPVPIRQASLETSNAQIIDTIDNVEQSDNALLESAFTSGEDGTQGCKRHLVEFIDQEDLSYRPIDKAARTTYVGTDVSNINFLIRESDQRSKAHHFPTNRIDRRFTTHEPDRVPVEAFQLPEKAIVDDLLHAYFEKINPGFPVVDQETFMAQYQARDPSDPPSLLLLHAVLLVGAHVSRDHTALKPVFFRRAKILIDSRFERNRDVIVQTALLLTWYSDGPEDVAANAWHWIGFASRVAMGLGMHRDAEPSTLVEHNKRMWRRVWWLLVQCDLLITLQYGRPLAINLDDCDVQAPKPTDYANCGANTQVDYAIAMTELCILLCSVYRKCFGPQSTRIRRQDMLAEADEKLARWSLLLPSHLRLRPTLMLDLWPASLHLIYNTALILLHRPRPQTLDPGSPSSLPTSNDAEICSAAAGVIQSIFESLCERQHLSTLWVFSVTALFTSMIQLGVEVRFTNPLLAIAAVRRYDSTLYSLRRLAEYWPSAESILHFFEHSERLQRQNVHLNQETSRPHQLLASPCSTGHNQKNRTELPPRSIMRHIPQDTTFDSAPHHSSVSSIRGTENTGVSNDDTTDATKDWRQLFPFTDAFEPEGAQTTAFLEHWKELYWQEPFDLGPEFEM